MKEQDPSSSSTYGPHDNELLSLAFDCTEMVTELSKGYKLERQGDHESAMSTIGTVESRIDSWVKKIDSLNTEEIDEEKLCQDLEEAKEALRLDL